MVFHSGTARPETLCSLSEAVSVPLSRLIVIIIIIITVVPFILLEERVPALELLNNELMWRLLQFQL